MLSNEEKKEMLEDAKSIKRKKDFRYAQKTGKDIISYDQYLRLLEDVQRIFGHFKISHHITVTKMNKL